MADDFLTELFALMSRDIVRARLIRDVAVAKPAAGAEWVQKVPGGVVWEVLAVHASLVTSAVVANRAPAVAFQNADGGEVARAQPVAVITAGLTTSLSYLTGYGDHLAVSGQTAGLPFTPITLSPGYIITSATTAIDVGDQYANVIVTVREWDVTGVMQEVEELDEQFQAYISRRS